MKSDIEIARSIELTKIKQVARDYDIPHGLCAKPALKALSTAAPAIPPTQA